MASKLPADPNRPKPSLADFEGWLRSDRKRQEASSPDFAARVFERIQSPGKTTDRRAVLRPILGWGIAAVCTTALLLGLHALTQTPASSTGAVSTAPINILLEEEVLLYASLLQGFDPEVFFEITDLLEWSLNGG